MMYSIRFKRITPIYSLWLIETKKKNETWHREKRHFLSCNKKKVLRNLRRYISTTWISDKSPSRGLVPDVYDGSWVFVGENSALTRTLYIASAFKPLIIADVADAALGSVGVNSGHWLSGLFSALSL
jgi:hypothetical protein